MKIATASGGVPKKAGRNDKWKIGRYMCNLNIPPKDFKVLFLDMNSFFASVEQQVQPILRGKPVGVAPYTGDSGCIIAASREAKVMGVKIGRVGEMKKICPKIKIVESRPALYMIYHKEIKKVIESFTPYFEPLSIDEFVLRLTPNDQNYEKSVLLAGQLKTAIREKVGDFLTCSIGVGPSKFLAKMAGERKKPDGLTVVRLFDLKNFYSSISLLDITGINYRMQDRLNFLNINSPAELLRCSLSFLTARLGHMGRLWYFRLRGYEVDDFSSSTKTIGHSHVLPPEYRSREGAEAVIHKLIFKTAFRLRKENFWAGGVSVCVGFLDRSSFALSKKTTRFCDTKSLTNHIFLLLKNCRWQNRPIYVNISTFDLAQFCGNQISIFSDIEKQKSVSFALDKINDQYGPDTVFPASMFKAHNSAPDRIPFGKPRYDILH